MVLVLSHSHSSCAESIWCTHSQTTPLLLHLSSLRFGLWLHFFLGGAYTPVGPKDCTKFGSDSTTAVYTVCDWIVPAFQLGFRFPLKVWRKGGWGADVISESNCSYHDGGSNFRRGQGGLDLVPPSADVTIALFVGRGHLLIRKTNFKHRSRKKRQEKAALRLEKKRCAKEQRQNR